MVELMQFIKETIGFSSMHFGDNGITLFNPSGIDNEKLSSKVAPLGLRYSEMTPTILPDGTTKQYRSAKDGTWRDEQHILVIGKAVDQSPEAMAAHMDKIIQS